MPVESEFTRLIPKIYRNNYEKLALFFFVKGQLQMLPTMGLKLAINNFRRFTGITEDEWDYNCMRTLYNNTQKEFIDLKYKNAITEKDKRTIKKQGFVS